MRPRFPLPGIQLILKGGDGLGIQVVLEKQDLVAEGRRTGWSCFRLAPWGDELAVAAAGLAKLCSLLPAARSCVFVELILPFFKERPGDIFDRADAAADRTGLRLAAFIFGLELFVPGLEVAALEVQDAAELFEGGGELLLGLVLGVTGLNDPIHEDLPLVFAEGFHGAVVGLLAAAEKEGGDRKGQSEFVQSVRMASPLG